MVYHPPQEILDKYADLLIRFALNDYKGINKGDVVYLHVPECAKPMLVSLRRSVLQAGGHPIVQFIPDGMGREFYELASEEQLSFFPEHSLKGKIAQADHTVTIIAESDKYELKGIDPANIMKRGEALKQYREWRDEKETKGEFTWTLALYGTEAMAQDVGMTVEEYWEEIITACYLREEDPTQKWKEITTEIERVKRALNDLSIQKLHVASENTDLIVGIGKNREWLGGSGRNIPSFEVFISPDKRMTEGTVHFNKPLYRYGQKAQDITVTFKEGKAIVIQAGEGEELLKEMIATPGADMIGEFSLTDSRLSKITKFMGETLFDENVGGEYGNMHIAFGNAYKDSYPGDASAISKEQWDEMGYNESSVHTDVISTEDKTVTATLADGSEKVIYENGKFVV